MSVISGVVQSVSEIDKLIATESLRQIDLKYPLMASRYTEYDRVRCLLCAVEFWASMEWIHSGANYCQVCKSKVAHNLGRRIHNFLYYCYISRD